MSEERRTLHWADYVVFAATLVISMLIGIYYAVSGGKQKTTSEYLMGGRKMGMIPVAVSMFMSYISAIFVLGTSAEMYTFGSQLWLQSAGSAIANMLSSHIFVPLLWPLKITSVYSYHKMRYNSEALRITAVVLQVTNQILYMGVAMYAPATALEAVTGFPVWASVVCTGVVATIYTTIGGMKAVVWTDVFQGGILMGGMLLVMIMSLVRIGGFGEMWRICNEGGRLNFFNFDPDPTVRMTFWSVVIGRIFFQLTQGGTSQQNVQRYNSLPTLWQAKGSVLFGIPMQLSVYSIVCLTGLSVYAYFTSIGCDPLRAGYISSSNQIMPYYILNVLGYPGLSGLFIAVLFSGALSSLSSSMNSMAAITWKDGLDRIPRFKDISESRKALANKILCFVYGALGCFAAFLFQVMTGHVMQLSQSILGGISGPLAGIIIIGVFFPFANWIGAISGVLCGVGMTSWLNIGFQLSRPYRERLPTSVMNCTFPPNATLAPLPTNPTDIFIMHRISYMWSPVVGVFTSVIVGTLVSLITSRGKHQDVDPRLIMPFSDRFCCCCPLGCQKACWCGMDHTFRYTKDDDESKEETKTGEQLGKEYELQNGYTNKGFDTEETKMSSESLPGLTTVPKDDQLQKGASTALNAQLPQRADNRLSTQL